MTDEKQTPAAAGFNDPNYFLLREFEAQCSQLESKILKLRVRVLEKLEQEQQQLTAWLKELKAERKRLNQEVKRLEASGNTSIVAQSDFMEVVKPLAALEGRIAELEVEKDALVDCKRQLKLEKRKAAAAALAVKSALRQFNT